ncbi:uncharacterized protein FTOL_00081 [Fusarium torulosum]|uniref:Chromo domain-containing protein n=1 Tax=Fusarium torulosum TaxID=33205 RepID=A0AAE8LXL0_9HYPO|nr:uncharacterized protein FTOL_00081 [Fusarium torulosum]
MASTARPSTYESESQHRRSGPQQDQDEDWSDSASDEQAKQTKSPKRHYKLGHKPSDHYRRHTSESPSQFPDDSYMRQARNATVPYGYSYDPSQSPSCQAHPISPMQYFPSFASQAPARYPSSYTYPGQGSYLSVPQTGNPFEQPCGPSPCGHPYKGYSESAYGFDKYNYDQGAPPPPEYPTQDPLRTPVRPREPRTPNVQPQRDTSNMYRDKVERKPRKKRPPMPKEEETLPENNITNAEIMETLKKIQQELKENAEIRLDPGRREYHRRRSSPPASKFLLDDATALENERQEIRQLNGIIRRLLEDRWDQESQDSYAGTSRRSFADSRQNRTEMDYRETALMSPRDLQSLKSRLDLIIDYLEIRNSPSPQQLPEVYNNRQGSRIPRRQVFLVSDPSMLEPTSPTSSRSPSRRSEHFQPRGNQRQDAQASNQSRIRQQPSRIPESEEVPEEYLEEYEALRVPLSETMQGRPLGSNKSIGSQSKGRSQPSVGQRTKGLASKEKALGSISPLNPSTARHSPDSQDLLPFETASSVVITSHSVNQEDHITNLPHYTTKFLEDEVQDVHPKMVYTFWNKLGGRCQAYQLSIDVVYGILNGAANCYLVQWTGYDETEAS